VLLIIELLCIRFKMRAVFINIHIQMRIIIHGWTGTL